MTQVTIGTFTYPSFASVDFADQYLAADIARSTRWALAQEPAKGRGLVSATRLILSLPLAQPVPDPSQDPAPIVLQEVTAMLAADLVAKPRLQGNAGGSTNVKIAKAGSAQVEFFAPVEGGPPFPRQLWDLLVAAGLIGNADDDAIMLDGAMPFGICGGVRPIYGRNACEWLIASEDYDG